MGKYANKKKKTTSKERHKAKRDKKALAAQEHRLNQIIKRRAVFESRVKSLQESCSSVTSSYMNTKDEFTLSVMDDDLATISGRLIFTGRAHAHINHLSTKIDSER